MTGAAHRPTLYRIWIADVGPWRARQWDELPPSAVAVEPAQELCLPAAEAMLLVEGFNREMLHRAGPLWAVAVPVELRYDGEPAPGGDLAARAWRFSARCGH